MRSPFTRTLAGVACVILGSCYSDVTRNVRHRFASDYRCDDFTVSERQGVLGSGYYIAEGCGRRVEYACETTDRVGFAVGDSPAPRRRDTFCNARALNTPPAPGRTEARAPRDERRGAQRVTDGERGLTYVGLTVAVSWWELRFIAPERDGQLTGEVAIVLRAATASSLLQRCAELTILSGGETTRLVSTEAVAEGRVVQYRAEIGALRAVATSDRIRFEACNVTHDLSEAERSDLRQFVLMATPSP